MPRYVQSGATVRLAACTWVTWLKWCRCTGWGLGRKGSSAWLMYTQTGCALAREEGEGEEGKRALFALQGMRRAPRAAGTKRSRAKRGVHTADAANARARDLVVN